MNLNLTEIPIQKLHSLSINGVETSILRLDLVHPIISGNKWFKIKFYLEEAIKYNKYGIMSFGGAYSNHIVALAFACNKRGLKSIGFIRGEKPAQLSPTLIAAASYGMELHFISREKYNNKNNLFKEFDIQNWLLVNEGGYGTLGAEGAATITELFEQNSYSNIICSVGTGTMIAGIIKRANEHQQILGISALKNNFSILNEMESLLTETDKKKNYFINHEYHFGGYAKHTKLLINFMNNLWKIEQLKTDMVYTGKLLFATTELINNKYFKPKSNILIIHSGGLQGNSSLSNGQLLF